MTWWMPATELKRPSKRGSAVMTDKWEVWVRQPSGVWRRATTTYSAEHVELLRKSYLQRWDEVRIDHRSSHIYVREAAA